MDSETKQGFTKPPWTVEPINNGETYQIVRWMDDSDNPGPYVIAETQTGSDEDAANARLIAQAPEMYRALKRVRQIIEDSEQWWMDCPDKGGFDTDDLDAVIAAVEAESR